jgi:HPt (histidine-containing phosphotransfer) domain-containing protein
MSSGNTQQPGMSEALDRLWKQYLPTMEERVAILQKAARSLAGRELSDDERAEANSAAHKLAGVLGTFGLTKGTVLAREAEIRYSGDNGTDPENAEQLVKIAEQLRAMIAGRK